VSGFWSLSVAVLLSKLNMQCHCVYLRNESLKIYFLNSHRPCRKRAYFLVKIFLKNCDNIWSFFQKNFWPHCREPT
jgi:hypothetical protein